jgi:hypothetical protein
MQSPGARIGWCERRKPGPRHHLNVHPLANPILCLACNYPFLGERDPRAALREIRVRYRDFHDRRARLHFLLPCLFSWGDQKILNGNIEWNLFIGTVVDS